MIATIETFFGRDALGTPAAFLAALFIGVAFGFALEQAGFGSSRRLSGIFYFRDMTVLKVMFTALIVAMLGLSYFLALGWVDASQIFILPSIYGAQIIGGLVFGVGFVLGGWCPGTAAVGLASGKVDALIFLAGIVLGSIAFNEAYPSIASLYTLGDSGVQLAWKNLGVSPAAFAIAFTLVAVGCFWGAETIEKKRVGGGGFLGTPFLKAFSLILVALAAGLFILPGPEGMSASGGAADVAGHEAALLGEVEGAADHMEPEDLADRLMAGEPELVVVDVRSEVEFAASHIPGAIRVSLPDLPAALAPHKDRGTIVLYSNGMTHPAQARDALARLGFRNVYHLTDGFAGFRDRCLRPVSLRSGPVPPDLAAKINAWRAFFSRGAAGMAAAASDVAEPPEKLPGLVDTAWLSGRLGHEDVKVIDCRAQPNWNGGHIPGSTCMSPEHFRGAVKGIPASLLPVDLLARHMSLLGIRPRDTVVIVGDDKVQDATLIGLALERLGHRKYAVLQGGFSKWASEKLPLDTVLPPAPANTGYPADPQADRFSVDAAFVLERVRKGDAIILDVRPADYFTGKKSDEARAGHIPGAINRPFSEDVTKVGEAVVVKPVEELAKAYAAIIPSRDSVVIVHCRTGHQASQTYFVLKHLLGYRSVLWYGPGWTEWSARPELPVQKD